MSHDLRLQGIITALVTPMTSDGNSVDEMRITGLVQSQVEAGVGGIVSGGSSGEFAALSMAERQLVTAAIVNSVAGRVPVIAHASCVTTRDAVELSRHAETVGASAVLVMPPFNEQLPWPEVLTYYQSISSAVELPVIAYNIPSATGIDFSADQLRELARTAGVRYVKYGSPNSRGFDELVRDHTLGVEVITAWDSLNFANFLSGATSCITGASNLVPGLWVALFNSIHRDQNLADARKIWNLLWPICHFLESEAYVPSLKASYELAGIPVGPPRQPQLPLNEAAKQQLARLLEPAINHIGSVTRR